MYECNHAEAGRAKAVFALVVSKACVEHEQRLVAVQYATQIPYHLFLRRFLVN